MQVVNYIPKKQNPVITLLEERLDEKNIHISADRYKFRKERYLERITELLTYARTERKCRSQFLLAYFGELNAKRCGRCDVCVGKKDTPHSPKELAAAEAKVLEVLDAQPSALTAIAEGTQLDPDLVATVLSQLREEGRIRRRQDLLFERKDN
jgi:ATP-dependent DNA helicase RecQ